MIEQRVVEVAVQRMNGSAESQDRDLLAVEEPLESRLGYGTAEGRRSRSITVTMRTPGSDIEAPGLPPTLRAARRAGVGTRLLYFDHRAAQSLRPSWVPRQSVGHESHAG